ncbi:enoyl-CoA hydratase [Seongchinamella sediminis]|uniref:Enoyl-CoA hydratase n=1 Tax=Seongchinamella sediminis TaxID=2283635 RepID=A0A3L7DYY9_9GAMM|nr:enoyl-CoA hydratase [Seongchinamella sediminis]RLQ21875.1 enoyl-CoA hydratase [Seongchinamella sediminis]
MSAQQAVLTELSEGVMLITLNRPQSYNAISRALVDGLVAAMRQAEADDTVRAIVMTGAGKAFCAGVDLKELSAGDDVLADDDELQAVFSACSKPLVGAINGVAVTGGLELALHCDFLYAADNARFGDTHARVGLMPTWGMSQKLSRIVGINRAREMSLAGALIDAQTALDWGLVNKVCSAETLLQETLATARQIAGNQTAAVSGIRKLVNDGWQTTLAQGLAIEDERSRPFNAAQDVSVMAERLGQVKKSNR